MSRLARVRADDSGFTLIELVVTIVVMGVIFVPLADFFIQYLTSYNQTQQRLSDSHDLQIAAAYFSQDVANTGLRDQSLNQVTFATKQSVWTSNFPAFCAPIVGTPILMLKGDAESVGSGSGSDTVTSVAYVVNGGTLVRLSCSGSIAAPSVTVVHNLDPNNPPVVSCSTGCNVTPSPVTIRLTVGVSSGPNDTSATSVPLTGQRRQDPS